MSQGRQTHSMTELLAIMAKLRNRDGGCPWDLEQNFQTIAPYTVEEAYEVQDAIDRNDMVQLMSELGDLLFQVVFHSQMASELELFSFEDVVSCICEKMIRRHPHVFSNAKIDSAEAQTIAWEEHKRRERQERGTSALDDVPLPLPALTRALKIQKRAATLGFDWSNVEHVFNKLEEEIGELREAMQQAASRAKLADELGDMLFVVANLARHVGVDPEQALKGTNQKFARRFAYIEDKMKSSGRSMTEVTLKEMDQAWDEAKALEPKLI